MTPEERFERIEGNLELMSEHLVRFDERLDQMTTRMDQMTAIGARTDARRDRAIRLAVRDTLSERRKHREAIAEIDEKITQLAAAQLLTQEELQDLNAQYTPSSSP